MADFNHPLWKEVKGIIHKGYGIKLITMMNLLDFVQNGSHAPHPNFCPPKAGRSAESALIGASTAGDQGGDGPVSKFCPLIIIHMNKMPSRKRKTVEIF